MVPNPQQMGKGIVLMPAPRPGPGSDPPEKVPLFASDDILCERYKVIRFIARGGMGEVTK